MRARGCLIAAASPGLQLIVPESVARRAVVLALLSSGGVSRVRTVAVRPGHRGLDVECAATMRDEAKAGPVALYAGESVGEALRRLGLRAAGMRLTLYRAGMETGQFYQLRP